MANQDEKERPEPLKSFVGSYLGSYQLVEPAGSGGVAQVYKARHMHPAYSENVFAIKLLHSELLQDANFVSLFRDEAYVLSVLQHPNIVRTFEAGIEDGTPYLAMEFVDGVDLAGVLHRLRFTGQRLPVALALYLVRQVLAGLDFAHRAMDADGKPLELIHRDVNPQNVFISFDGEIKLGDFGIAVMGSEGRASQAAGKVGYFAPEQTSGSIDHRADIFAVGVMLYELLCGELPFVGESADEVLQANLAVNCLRPRKVNPDLSAGLESLILDAMTADPSARIPTAEAMGDRVAVQLQELAMGAAAADELEMGLRPAVGALVRGLFADVHARGLERRFQLGNGGTLKGHGCRVVLMGGSPDERRTRCELLLSCGYRPEEIAFPGDPIQLPEGSAVVLVDLDDPECLPEAIARTLTGIGRPVPWVGLTAILAPSPAVLTSETLGAEELVCGEPGSTEAARCRFKLRLLNALWIARCSAERGSARSAQAMEDTPPTVQARRVAGDASVKQESSPSNAPIPDADDALGQDANDVLDPLMAPPLAVPKPRPGRGPGRSAKGDETRLAGARQDQQGDAFVGTASDKPPPLPVLFVTQDAPLRESLAKVLPSFGFPMEVARTQADMLGQARQSIHHAVVMDWLSDDWQEAEAWMSRLRTVPGIALLPVLYLVQTQRFVAARQHLGQIACSSIRPRTDAPMGIARALQSLTAGSRRRRSFVRFRASWPVHIRYGGRVLEGRLQDISRGGVMIETQGILPLGARLGVVLHFPEGIAEVRGEVLRIDRPQGASAGRVGIVFLQMQRRDELRITDTICKLTEALKARALAARGPSAQELGKTQKMKPRGLTLG